MRPLVATFLFLFATESSYAQPARQSDLDEIRAAQRVILERLEVIQRQLDSLTTIVGMPRPAPVVTASPKGTLESVSVRDTRTQGSEMARVGIAVFSDFQCPHCSRFFADALPKLLSEYIESGRLLLSFRHLPSASHPHAFMAANAAECAGDQGKFWQMHDELFKEQALIGAERLRYYASSLDLDRSPFDECLTEGGAPRVRRDLTLAATLKVAATPTFLIGMLGRDGVLRVTETVSGYRTYDDLRGVIERVFKGIN